MVYTDKRSQIVIDDAKVNPLDGIRTTDEDVRNIFSSYILSASGWRHVFAASGDEEDAATEIKDADKVIATCIAISYFRYLDMKHPKVLLGIDARPTGRILAAIAARTLLALGAEVTYLFISAAPEIMAYSHAGYDSFFYISASHNPIGHNGFKFGRDGGVFSKEEAGVLTDMLKKLISSGNSIEETAKIASLYDSTEYEKVLEGVENAKEEALSYYRSFVLRTAGKDESFRSTAGIAADFNGSARALSIDADFIKSIGCEFNAINARAGEVAHAIVPEGENLIPCRDFLVECHRKDSRFILGYTPDNDGDRGNFVYIKQDGSADILEAQEVFALVVAVELAELSMNGEKNLAVAVNGPTSERIDTLAAAFGAKVFRAEVGEANVVNLAAKLRSEGYLVHILGEGSNGGNITDPAKVRDPLNSVMTILKLFSGDRLYSYLREKLGYEGGVPSVSGVIEALPAYTTTGAFSTLAKMHVRHTDYRALKKAYESFLSLSFEKAELDKYGITGYEVRQTEGTVERIGAGEEYRTGECKGGLKVVFLDRDNNHVAYMWTRPSGTEPVLRVLVDVKGDNVQLHDKLLSWQRTLIAEADASLN